MLLLYNFQTHPSLQAMEGLAKLTGETVRHVAPSEYSLPLGKLVFGPFYQPQGSPDDHLPEGTALKDSIDDPMLIFAGMEQTKAMDLIDKMKKLGISVPLKAVITPTNQAWSSFLLYTHLKAEYDYYQSHRT